MKKMLLILFVAILMLVSACKGKDNSNDKLNIGFIYVGTVADNGWTYAHSKGQQEVSEMEIVNETFYYQNISTRKRTEEVIDELINEKNCKMIFTTSHDHLEATLAKAKEYPDVVFENCSGFVKTDNVSSYFGKIYKPWYIAGQLAGIKTVTNKIGILSAHQINECLRIVNAFTLGVKSVNPDAVVKVEFTHSWCAPPKEKTLSEYLISQGCDVLAHDTDSSEPEIVSEKAGVWSIGYNSDKSKFAPDMHLTSVIWNWAPYYIERVNKFAKGVWQPAITWGGYETDMFGLTPFRDILKPEEAIIIDNTLEKIKSKELNIFTGPIYDNKGNIRVKEGQVLTDAELLKIDWLVKGVDGNLFEQ